MITSRKFITLLAGGRNTPPSLLDDDVIYWTLDEESDGSAPVTRLDSGTNALHLADNDNVPSAVGKLSNGADFEKDNTEYLSHAHDALLSGAGSWTIAVWAKPESLANNDAVIVKPTDYLLVNITDSPFFYKYINAGNQALSTSLANSEKFVVGNWTLVIFGYNAATAKQFMQVNNGVYYEKDVVLPVQPSSTFQIGWWTGAGTYFDGIIDEVGRWSRVLTETERSALYNSGNGITYPFVGQSGTALPVYVGPTGGADRLTNFQAAINAGYSKILLLGDSWIDGGDTTEVGGPLPNGLRTSLQTEYGDAGIGYLKFPHGVTNPDTRVTLYAQSAGFVNEFAAGHSVDCSEAAATGTATISYTATFDRIEIHYRQYATGGVFRFRVDAGGWQSVNTAGAEAYGKSAITGLTNVSHTVEIEWVSGTVALFGAEMTSGSTGCLVLRCGTSGQTSAHIPANAQFPAAVTAIDPDLTVIMLGTNDISGNVTPATYAANLLAIVNAIPASSDVLVCVSPDDSRDIRLGLTYNCKQYNQAAYNAIYSAGRVGWFSCVDDFGGFGATHPKLYWGTLHLTTAGYAYLAGLIYSAFLQGR